MTEESGNTRLLSTDVARDIDDALRGQVATLTRGLSPIDVATAVIDWAGHLALSPAKVLTLAESFIRNGVELGELNGRAMRQDELPPVADRRMRGDKWQQWVV